MKKIKDIGKKSSLERWKDHFKKEPFEALDKLLKGKVFIIAQSEFPDLILKQLFGSIKDPGEKEAFKVSLDNTLLELLKTYQASAFRVPDELYGPNPLVGVFSVKRGWNNTLWHAFGTIYYFELEKTAKWVIENYKTIREQLRGLWLHEKSDPEKDFLHYLSIIQPLVIFEEKIIKELYDLWMGLCKLKREDGDSLDLMYLNIGPNGLRYLPAKDEKEKIRNLWKGIILSAEALADREGGKERWFRFVRAMLVKEEGLRDELPEVFQELQESSCRSPAHQWMEELRERLRK